MWNKRLLALMLLLATSASVLLGQKATSYSTASNSAQPAQAAQLTAVPELRGRLQGVIDREEIADRVFPRLAVTSEGPSYLSRVILRFSDPDSEIVITTLLDGRPIVESYVLDPGVTIGASISQVLQRDPQASFDQVTNAIRVHKATIPVPQAHVARWFQEMNRVLPGKLPSTQIHLDGPQQFDLWIDANGDVIHYRFYEVPGEKRMNDGPFAPLARWMVKLDAEVSKFRRGARQ